MAAVHAGLRLAVLFRPRCKCWSCPACAQINRALWVRKAAWGAEKLLADHAQLTMLTLTSHRKLNPEQSLYVFKDAWPRLRKRAQRAAPGMAYIMMPERHKSGVLHVHALCTANLGTRWWKDAGAEVGLGYMNEEEPARDAVQSGRYVSKYLGKQLEGLAWPPGFHRVRRSRSWPKMPRPEPPAGWRFEVALSDVEARQLRDGLERSFYTLVDADHLAAWSIVLAVGGLDKETEVDL